MQMGRHETFKILLRSAVSGERVGNLDHSCLSPGLLHSVILLKLLRSCQVVISPVEKPISQGTKESSVRPPVKS